MNIIKLLKENVVYIAIISAFIAIVVISLQQKKQNEVIVRLNQEVPDFTLTDRDGNKIRLSDYRGKVVFLNFWASWCKPCKEEMPSMEILYRTFNHQGLEMIAVNVERMEKMNTLLGKSNVESFIDKLDLSFHVIHDGWGEVDRAYKITGVPETYIIDKKGILVEKVLGARNWTRESNIKTIINLLGVKAPSENQPGVS